MSSKTGKPNKEVEHGSRAGNLSCRVGIEQGDQDAGHGRPSKES